MLTIHTLLWASRTSQTSSSKSYSAVEHVLFLLTADAGAALCRKPPLLSSFNFCTTLCTRTFKKTGSSHTHLTNLFQMKGIDTGSCNPPIKMAEASMTWKVHVAFRIFKTQDLRCKNSNVFAKGARNKNVHYYLPYYH